MIEIIHGDARNLDMIEDESVDLIVTSPPYFNLRKYQDNGSTYDTQIGLESNPTEFVASLIECTREMMRVLKPTGSIFVNLGDKYSHRGSLYMIPERYRIAATDILGMTARAVVVWSKPGGEFGSVDDRVRRTHEDWVHLTKSRVYFSDLDAIREESLTVVTASGAVRYRKPGEVTTSHVKKLTSSSKWNSDRADGGAPTSASYNPRGKIPASVWSVNTQQLRVPKNLELVHNAPFPMEFPRRFILGWCPEGGTVLDPFGGTGTTALVADVHGRRGISVDASSDYCRLAEWRVNDPKQRERASRPANPVRGAVVTEGTSDAA